MPIARGRVAGRIEILDLSEEEFAGALRTLLGAGYVVIANPRDRMLTLELGRDPSYDSTDMTVLVSMIKLLEGKIVPGFIALPDED